MKPGIYLTEKEILEQKTDLPPIKKILDEFYDPNVKIFTEEALNKFADEFWIYPCSNRMAAMISDRKFHNPFDLVIPGGNLNHLIFGDYVIVETLRRRPCFTKEKVIVDGIDYYPPKPKWKDVARSIFLLHDGCKNGIDSWGKRMFREHGLLTAEFLKRLPSFKKLNSFQKKHILNGVKWHMGRFGPLPIRPLRKLLGKPLFTEFERVVQEADYHSTLTILTGVDIQLINYPPKP